MAEQQMRLSMGILIDIVDDEWMRDTLPDDGDASLPTPRTSSRLFSLCSSHVLQFSIFYISDIPLPSVMVAKTDDVEDSRKQTLTI